MAYEVRALKSIPSVREWETIKNLEDFETAGVLVTTGNIESVISVDLSGIDLSRKGFNKIKKQKAHIFLKLFRFHIVNTFLFSFRKFFNTNNKK